MERDLLNHFVERYQNKDRDGILALLAEDVVVSDPHFPKTTMVGIKEVKRGLNWSFGAIKRTDLTIASMTVSGSTAFIELDTTHHLKVGLTYSYLQVLKIDFKADKIQSITTYVTYSPGGIRGVLRRGFALAWKINDVMRSKYLPTVGHVTQ